MTKSNILSDFEIQEITDTVIGHYVTFEDLNKLVDDINYAYAVKGYVTAKAFLPPQTIQDGVVKITLVEGLVGDVTISGNKYTSSRYIEKRLSVKNGDVFQIMQLEQDVVKFNQYNPGVRLNASLTKRKNRRYNWRSDKSGRKIPVPRSRFNG